MSDPITNATKDDDFDAVLNNDQKEPVAPVKDDLVGAPVPRRTGDKVAPVSSVPENGVRNVTQLMTEDAKIMKKTLDAQPKVAFYIPLGPEEKLGQAYESVTINGYRLEIKKGMMVNVPQQVSEMLMEHMNIQSSVGVDQRISSKSKEVQDALS